MNNLIILVNINANKEFNNNLRIFSLKQYFRIVCRSEADFGI